jgi:PAS domain S-box-containing protein
MDFLQEPLFQTLFDQLPEPRIVVKADSPRFTIIACNHQYKLVSNTLDKDIINKSMGEIYSLTAANPDGDAIVHKALNETITSKAVVKLDAIRYDIPNADGSRIEQSWWQAEYVPVMGADQQVEYVMCTTYNITEKIVNKENAEKSRQKEYQLNAQLTATNQELIAMNQKLQQSQANLAKLNASLEEHVVSRTIALAKNEQRLRSIVEQAPLGLCVLKGRDLIIESANDIILKTWGRNAPVIGKKLSVVLPELEEQNFLKILDNVYTSGQSFYGYEAKISFQHKDRINEVYLDFVYSPLKDETGEVSSVMISSINVTERARSRQREQYLNEELTITNEELVATNEELHHSQKSLQVLNAKLEELVAKRTKALIESEAKARYMIEGAPVAIGVFTGPELIIETANDKILELWGKNKEIVGKPLYLALPEIKGQAFIQILESVFSSGEAFFGNGLKAFLYRNDVLKEVYFNFVYQPIKDETGKTNSIMVVANDVTEQVNARSLVEESEKRFRFLLNAIPQQVWTAKPDGQLDYVNQVVSNDFNKSIDAIVGYGWQKFIFPDDLPNALKLWKASLETGSEYLVEFRLLMSNGQYLWHLARAVPLIEDGKIKFWLGTNTNIDFQKNNEQKKDEFLSIASHELKTPLTSIKAFNQMMKRTKDVDKLNSFVQKSAEHIFRLEKLINDLLDVTKINAGKMTYTMQQFSFKQMLQESIENVQHVAPSHQIIFNMADDINYFGDRFRLEQVVNNFLTNAVKYSPQAKTVIVNSKIEINNLIVSVQDFGIGIAKNNLNRLFERYYREDNSAMRFEGLGLGLFISSEILKRHQGSFWIESEQGQGSTFYFSLPLTETEEVQAVIQTDQYYQDSTITIIYNDENKRLDVDWKGFQNLETVQRGGTIMLKMLAENKCSKVVNDNRHVLGTWSEAVDWAGIEWFPMMEKAGLKYFAWIYSLSAFSQLSAKKSVDIAVGNITAQFFTDIALAEEWINSQPD